MRTLVKSLLTASAVFSLAPTAAFALPPQCSNSFCEANDCDTECFLGPKYPLTCGEYMGTPCLNGTPAPAEPTASVTGAEARQAEDASQVCSEEHPAAEQSLTAGT
ncbi:hypothetical protein HJC10_06495 [Corallococcus exiguus]|uniref:hypothetical protein n=1 Tax=Corallococcus TaxID=83461 RepID=UPI000EE75E24|nr:MULTISPECIES: hypothetical protein [Corallococcus]NNB85237.1 hypothetical protein [Corallococcus exiguus]NNB93314.1 hypothetical protein [Corallococcus exiguus]NNC02501.1 hypothetical protein [Corallococcus exiguus]NPC45950.1 hypothetical protein [Corallococcus exiguus]RKH83461.1 hypothetical protein D7X99_12650 [Corallococcus sp. AB032C]